MEPLAVVAITFTLGAITGAALVYLLWLTRDECAVLDKLAKGGYREEELRRSRRLYNPERGDPEEVATKRVARQGR